MSDIFSHAKVTTVATIRRIRKLPRGSVAKVAIGQPVQALDVIAAAEVSEQHRVLKAARRLRVSAKELPEYLKKQVGDTITRGEVIAERPILLGISSRRVFAPDDGRIVRVADGRIVVEGGRKRIEVIASVSGKVTSIDPGNYIVVETRGTLIQIAYGHGELSSGTLYVMDQETGIKTEAENRFNVDHRGVVVVIGSPLTEAFIKGAAEIKVKGIIAPSARSSLLPLIKKQDFPIALTKGFGEFPMSDRVLTLFNTYNGREAVLDLSQDADSHDSRPEIIIPLESSEVGREQEIEVKVKIGGKVRILQHPYFGEIGTVKSIPSESHQLENGLWMSGVIVDTPDKQTIFAPFTNLEYLG